MAKHHPVLVVGGSGIVGAQAALTLRRLHPDLPIAIGGRNLERAGKTARDVGNAEAVKVEVGQPGLGLTDKRFSAVVMFARPRATLPVARASWSKIGAASVSRKEKNSSHWSPAREAPPSAARSPSRDANSATIR